MKSSDHWGPFDPAITACERVARLRGLRAIVQLVAGSRGETVTRALRCAEDDASFLGSALQALEKLAALDKRRVWSSYLGLIAPTPPYAA
ncbi:hypothetical protein [Methylobacterium sp. WL116]|uniref:hypothetical protein n=1 Tax=Methylobacterium sp. WL116 TaxID=2603889 RepID=UPI00164FF019|nr:hypothetical protein [Methylobacterium sp. WL116]